MIGMKMGLLGIAFGIAFATFTVVSVSAPARSSNPLLAAPMPRCRPLRPAFEKLLEDLKQRRSWRGTHENSTGELELTVGRNGSWFLFFHSRDSHEQKLVCLIARGGNSQEYFGRPV